MYDFCPNCGSTMDGRQQTDGKMVSCRACGHDIGVVTVAKKEVVHQADQLVQDGSAAKCPECQQLVEVKVSGGVKSFVPHFQTGVRRMCPKAGKPIATPASSAQPSAAPAKRPPAGKDLSAYYTNEDAKVVACRRGADPTIEQLSLKYLDKSDRVRLQIDALRDILGASFKIRAYPSQLGRPHLGIWASAKEIVIAAKHEKGGYKSLSDGEITQVVNDLRSSPSLFFS